ncbi:DUF2254 domain-containing protein [Roseiconus lacunae]|uniref:DUF2254 domain-containing protein n=1 Tax=Roseiconus lacunae TaxID=2605694 RepID=UPI0011F2348C|nr:DUF2254 domain-containing protein [Roseiconus lacunae]
MKAQIQQVAYRISGSYWFVPTLMAIISLIASRFTIEIDRSIGVDWVEMVPIAALNQPEGARALLATVAGSMITVAGVTFSLTMVTVSHATSHYGPRLLDNMMRDRGNQVTLGTFVATFLYCLMVLRTVRSGDPDNEALQTTLFVPHLSVLIAFLLTLASVGVLIYFIHHIPESIHISNVLDNISRMAESKVGELFPEMLGEPRSSDSIEAIDWSDGLAVRSTRFGYLQGIDESGLMETAIQHGAVIHLLIRPGDRVLLGQQIATIKPSNGVADADTTPLIDALIRCLAIGNSRTPTQDLFFILHQFVEIAVRALSPGVNDPFTAIQCIDQIANSITLISLRKLPNPFRVDDEGHLRVVTVGLDWKQIIEESIDVLLPYALTDANVKAHLEETIKQIRSVTKVPQLDEQLDRLESELVAWKPLS